MQLTAPSSPTNPRARPRGDADDPASAAPVAPGTPRWPRRSSRWSVSCSISPAAVAATSEPCVPDPQTACLNGTMRTAAGDPAVGVQLEITGPEVSTTVTTGADGRWTLAVQQAGDYTVTLDVATLPAGETLRDPTTTSRVVSVELGRQGGALFPLGTPQTGGSTATSTATPTGGQTAGSGQDVTTSAPTGGSSNRVAQQFANGLVFGLLLALASVGLSLVYGTTGLSSFSHGEQVTLGAIMAYVFTQLVGLPLWLSALTAIAIGGASGWLQDAGIWSQLRRRRVGTTQQMIVTIGLSMALQYLFQFLFGGGRLRIVTASSSPVYIGPVVLSVQTLTLGVHRDRRAGRRRLLPAVHPHRSRHSRGLGQPRTGGRVGHRRRAGGPHRLGGRDRTGGAGRRAHRACTSRRPPGTWAARSCC